MRWKRWMCLAWLCLIPFSGNAATPMVANGWHSLALKNDGTVLAFGSDSFGQLGLGQIVQSATPVQAQGLNGVVAVSTGFWYVLAVKSDGTVWAWGNGNLGDGTRTPSNTPVQAQGLSGVTAVAAGTASVALKSDGTVWTWGGNNYGQLGYGVPGRGGLLPAQVPGLSGMTRIGTGWGHTAALKNNGTVWAWGNNASGQLGDGATSQRTAPAQVPGLTGITDIAVGWNHTVALKSDGTVWEWGANGYGQLGDGTTADRSQPIQVPGLTGVTAISAGMAHTLALDAAGTIWAWGWNGYGQLGNGTTTSSATPIQVPGLTAVVAIAAELGHTVALKSDGSIWSWGSNASGELGDGTTVARASPVRAAQGLTGITSLSAGLGSTTALKSDGTVWSWGANGYGQLGIGGVTGRTTPATVPGLNGVTKIAANFTNSMALKADGTVWVWGSYSGNGLGASSVPVRVPGLSGATAIASGVAFGMAVIHDGTVWAWGWNGLGQLGDGIAIDGVTVVPVQVGGLSGITAVSGSVDHALALRSDGTVWGWGSNEYGKLGIASQRTCNSFMGGNVPCNPVPAQVPGLSGVVAIVAADKRSLALKSDGTIWSWGASWNWCCPSDALTGSAIPAQIPGLTGMVAISYEIALKSDGTVWEWAPFGSAPRQVQGLSGMTAVAGSDMDSLAVKSDGTVWAWGENTFGALGDGTYAPKLLTPVLVVNETLNGPLDLIPEGSNSIPPDKIPPFFVAAYKSGGLSATSLYADIRGLGASATFASATDFGSFAAGYNVYVAANVPSMQSAYFQLDSNNNWSALSWPMAEFVRGVALDSQNTLVRVQILQNVNVSQLPGASIIVGYGTDPDEMLRAARYRTIFTVPQQ
jgi:alpha-tubulin suppressor-like RCC1 family protein